MWVLVDSGLSEEFESFAHCLRISELVGLDCVEQYLPHRVAMQFGIDQDLPACVTGASETVSIAWSKYIKSIGCANVYVPSWLFEADVTTRYSEWWKQSVSHLQGAKKEKVCDVPASAGLPSEKLPPSQIVQKKLNDSPGPPDFPLKSNLVEPEESTDEDGLTISELFRTSKRHDAVRSGHLVNGESLGNFTNLRSFSSFMADKEVTKYINPLTVSIENVTLNATVETGLETAKEDADATETGSPSHDMESFQGSETDDDRYEAEIQELQIEERVSVLKKIFAELKAKRYVCK
ncbi:hypothetical protein LWI28_026827 [Acer negundo]|uniref:Aminotransferase-like plant mobile domain-containing protein n=1 Tax=Acer negundo TaxID=4023 RepID=A0AAD5J8I4_ACENE|nr:hypothetical protein LWI28_026827 [Acer negundo]